MRWQCGCCCRVLCGWFFVVASACCSVLPSTVALAIWLGLGDTGVDGDSWITPHGVGRGVQRPMPGGRRRPTMHGSLGVNSLLRGVIAAPIWVSRVAEALGGAEADEAAEAHVG